MHSTHPHAEKKVLLLNHTDATNDKISIIPGNKTKTKTKELEALANVHGILQSYTTGVSEAI